MILRIFYKANSVAGGDTDHGDKKEECDAMLFNKMMEILRAGIRLFFEELLILQHHNLVERNCNF